MLFAFNDCRNFFTFISLIMDALLAKADAIQPLTKRRKTSYIASKQRTKRPQDVSSTDRTLHSIAKHTSIPKSLNNLPETQPTHTHIANKKLRAELNRHTAQSARAKALLEDAEMLLADEAGKIEVEGEMERTWRVGQDDIVQGAGQEAAKGRREWKLDGGPYRSRYTRNGRSAIVSPFHWPLLLKYGFIGGQASCDCGKIGACCYV
jgi:U3 small nucleolar RNA-associated protein 7